MFGNELDFSWTILSVLVSPEIKINVFGAQGHVRKVRNHRNEGFEGSHISKSKSYKLKSKQNHITELLDILLPQVYNTNGPTIAKHVNIVGFSGFPKESSYI